MSRGKFIVIDGNGGCGKSTIINFLKEIYPDFHYTREPGGSILSEDIRTVMMSENARDADGYTQFALVWASRRDHLVKTIRPKIEEGISVVSDRFDSTTWSYQLFAQECGDLKDIALSVRELFLGDTKPDLYIYLDVDAKEGKRRIDNRDREKSHFHDQPVEYYEKTRAGFLDFAKNFPNVVTVDANAPLEEVKRVVKIEVDRVVKQ